MNANKRKFMMFQFFVPAILNTLDFSICLKLFVMPAKAGIQDVVKHKFFWILDSGSVLSLHPE